MRPAAACPIKSYVGEYKGISFVELICDGYGVHVFEHQGSWKTTSFHLGSIMDGEDPDEVIQCLPSGPEYAEKMSKAWQAAADLIRKHQFPAQENQRKEENMLTEEEWKSIVKARLHKAKNALNEVASLTDNLTTSRENIEGAWEHFLRLHEQARQALTQFLEVKTATPRSAGHAAVLRERKA